MARGIVAGSPQPIALVDPFSKEGYPNAVAKIAQRHLMLGDTVTEGAPGGAVFYWSSPIINLNNDNETYLVYFKNNSAVRQVIRDINLNLSESVETLVGTVLSKLQTVKVRFLSNPTGGTLLSGGTELAVKDLLFGQPDLTNVNSRYGPGTVLGAATFGHEIAAAGQQNPLATGFVLDPGQAFVMSVQAPTSSVSMDTQINFRVVPREEVV